MNRDLLPVRPRRRAQRLQGRVPRARGRDRARSHRGAYIVAPTHRSILDVPFAAFITRRTICFLAKEELFAKPILSRLFTALGAVQVERGTADRGALRALEAALRDGSPVAVFPEGTRSSGPGDHAAVRRRRLPRGEARRADRPGRHRRQRGHPAQRARCYRASAGSQWWSASPSCRRCSRAERAAPPRPASPRSCTPSSSARSPTPSAWPLPPVGAH